MSPRAFLDFWKTPSGRLLLFAGLLGGGLALYGRYRQSATSVPPLEPGARLWPVPSNQLVETVHRPMQPFRPPPPRPEPIPPPREPLPRPEPPQATPPSSPSGSIAQSEPRAPLSLVPDVTAGKPRPKPPPEVYAPFGRLVPCRTVITIDSSSLQTPIIGLITEDLYFAGRLVIPAGTEVHGSASIDRPRQRLTSQSAWTLVWQTGEELPLRALALDREFRQAGEETGWGITDGSAGMRAQLLKSDQLAEIKLFAATFLSGAAQALTEKEPTLFGALDRRSLQNAPFRGAEEVLGAYAQRILDSIQRDGFHLRVPAGQEFYLYLLQSIDRADARRPGAPRVASQSPVNGTHDRPTEPTPTLEPQDPQP